MCSLVGQPSQALSQTADRGDQLHLLHVDIHSRPPQLVSSYLGQHVNELDIGWGDNDDLFAVVTRTRQRLPDRWVIARLAQYFDARVVGERRSGAEATLMRTAVHRDASASNARAEARRQARQAMVLTERRSTHDRGRYHA
jgi:hypothetical protein